MDCDGSTYEIASPLVAVAIDTPDFLETTLPHAGRGGSPWSYMIQKWRRGEKIYLAMFDVQAEWVDIAAEEAKATQEGLGSGASIEHSAFHVADIDIMNPDTVMTPSSHHKVTLLHMYVQVLVYRCGHLAQGLSCSILEASGRYWAAA